MIFFNLLVLVPLCISADTMPFRPGDTTVLDLRGSTLYNIGEEQFSGYSDITHLILSNCSIRSIHPKAFCSLTLLHMLDLSDNHIQHLHPDTFICNPSLTKLYLANNMELGVEFNKKFLKSHSLRYLDIKNCAFDSFSDDVLISLPNIITIIAPNSLVCSTLFRSSGKRTIMKCDEDGSENIPNNVFPRISVNSTSKELFVQEISTTLIPKDFLCDYNLTNIHSLHMSGLNIIDIHPLTLRGFHYLQSLDLSYNDIQYFQPNTFDCLPHLRNLTLSNNHRLGYGIHQTFIYSSSLEYLDIKNCNFASYFDGMFAFMKNLKTLVASGNRICTTLAKKLEFIEVFPCEVGKTDQRDRYQSLEYVSRSFFSDFTWQNVTRLDLSDRNISVIHPYAFCPLRHLIELDLSNNQLQYLDPLIFQCNPRLKTLYLTNNERLQSDPTKEFIRSTSLQFLDLQNCGFSTFTDKMFSKLYSLEFINAMGNPSCSQTTLYLRDKSNVPCTDVFDYKANAYEISYERELRPENESNSQIDARIRGFLIVVGLIGVLTTVVFVWLIKRKDAQQANNTEASLQEKDSLLR